MTGKFSLKNLYSREIAVSKKIKTAFPKWMVAATLASSLAVLAVGFLATQMFAWESAIYREHKQWKSELETGVALTLDQRVEGSNATATQEENSDTVRRWEGVLAQIDHPYLKAQQDLFTEESSIASPRDLNAGAFDSQAVWSKLPKEFTTLSWGRSRTHGFLRRFITARRTRFANWPFGTWLIAWHPKTKSDSRRE